MKALIVDDDVSVRQILAKLLARHGVEAVCVGDGRSAEKELGLNRDIGFVFLDLILPYISGWGVLDWIEEHNDTISTKVVLMTGASLSHEELEKLEKRVVGIMYKPQITMERIETILGFVTAG